MWKSGLPRRMTPTCLPYVNCEAACPHQTSPFSRRMHYLFTVNRIARLGQLQVRSGRLVT
jgi:hypothetical protein